MDVLRNTEDAVAAWLGQLGLADAVRPGRPTAIATGESVLFVSVFDQDELPWCRITAILLTDFEPTLGLLHRVLQLGNEVLMGGFRLFEDRTLAFSVTLPGTSLDSDTFANSVRYVAHVADTCSPELSRLGCGRSGADLLRRSASCGSPS